MHFYIKLNQTHPNFAYPKAQEKKEKGNNTCQSTIDNAIPHANIPINVSKTEIIT